MKQELNSKITSPLIKNRRSTVLNVLNLYGVYIFLVILLLLNIIITPNFFSFDTVNNLIMQGCPIIICSLGMLTVISSGGIDISIGSLMAFCSIIVVKMLYTGLSIPVACIIAILLTSVFGIITGYCVSKLSLQPMIITLGIQMIARGIGQAINNGHVELFQIPSFSMIGTTKIFGKLPIQAVYIVGLTIILYLLLYKTKFGRYVQAVGDNSKSCRLSGINTTFIIIMVYVICAVFGSLAAIIETARISSVNGGTMGKLMELDAIAAVCIGGTNMNGGKAKVFGAVVGAVIMTLISIMVNMNNVPDAWSYVLKAVVIIGAFYLQNISSRAGGK